MEAQHPDMQACIHDCLQCHERCLQDAMNHCLETGGAHVAPEHFRLMMSCAESCRRMSQAATGMQAFEGSRRQAASSPIKAPM